MLAAFYASIPIIPLYCEEIGITGSKVGIVLTAMPVATILFRPVAGYLLDNFNRYRVYLIFLALFCLSFPAFLAFPVFGALIVVRLYMGAVYSVCGSATMTLAGDVLPAAKVTQGISRFAFTVSIGMALGPFVGLQVQENLSSRASFLTIFGIAVAALVCVSLCRIKYPKVQRGRFSLKESIYAPALPFMFNMMFLMIPYGAVIAYSSILAQEKGLTPWLPYFYIFLVAGMLVSKLSTQKRTDAGNHRALVCASLVVLILTMASYLFLSTGVHLLAAGFTSAGPTAITAAARPPARQVKPPERAPGRMPRGIMRPLFPGQKQNEGPAEKPGPRFVSYSALAALMFSTSWAARSAQAPFLNRKS